MEGTVLPLEGCRGIGFNVFMTPGLRGLRSPRGQGRGHCRGRGPHFRRCPTSVVLGPWDGVPLPSLPEGLWEAKGPLGRREENPGIWGGGDLEAQAHPGLAGEVRRHARLFSPSSDVPRPGEAQALSPAWLPLALQTFPPPCNCPRLSTLPAEAPAAGRGGAS